MTNLKREWIIGRWSDSLQIGEDIVRDIDDSVWWSVCQCLSYWDSYLALTAIESKK